MTLPDFMDYKDKFTQRAFVEKISHVAKRASFTEPTLKRGIF